MHSTDWKLGAIKKITSAPQPRYNFNATVTKPICVFNLFFELRYPITHYHTGKKKKKKIQVMQGMDVYQHPFPKLL